MKFEYIDVTKTQFLDGKYVHSVVFSCESPSLSEADMLFEAKFGKNPGKMKEISVILYKNP